MQFYETFEHGADIGIRGYGKTLEEAFSSALKALAELLVEEPNWKELKLNEQASVRVEAEFLDELFVIFVNKVLGLFYEKKVLFLDFKGKILKKEENYELKGKVFGVPYDPERFGYGVEVKGATFTMAKVEKTVREEEVLWVAQCVVDV